MPFMERSRERYGDVFTLRIAQEGSWVFLTDPELVKQVFTGDPAVLHAGEANRRPAAGARPQLGAAARRAEHMAQRKLMLPPFHGERMQRYGELMAEVAARGDRAAGRSASRSRCWPRMQAVTLEVIMRAVFGVPRSSTGWTSCARACKQHARLDHPDARTMVAIAVLGPRADARRPGSSGARSTPVDEVLIDEIASAPRAPTTSPSATTFSRCSCRPATRTAAR